MLKHIPNIITLVNLLCGCGALVSVLNQQYDTTFYFLLVAGFADYSDGMVARLLKVNSPLGLQLDSLADMVSFGVVPHFVPPGDESIHSRNIFWPQSS